MMCVLNIQLLVEKIGDFVFDDTGSYWLFIVGATIFVGLLLAALTEKLMPKFPFKLVQVCFGLFGALQYFYLKDVFADTFQKSEWLSDFARTEWSVILIFLVGFLLADGSLKVGKEKTEN